jgi:4-hydroxy-2-oxoglutarate aldolase
MVSLYIRSLLLSSPKRTPNTASRTLSGELSHIPKMKGMGGRVIKGIYAPISTPFVNDEIAYDKLAENIEKYCQTKLTGFVVLGSNGEFALLDEEEKVELVKFVVKQTAGRKKIIVGTGQHSTKSTIRLTKKVADLGIQAALILVPSYYKDSMTDPIMEKFYTDCADASPVPTFIYNMPRNTGINVSSALVAKLARHPNIAGIKDSGGNIVQISEIIATTPNDFSVFAGSGSFLLTTLLMGGVGGTLAVANVLPNECADIQALFDAGKLDQARELQMKILDANKAVTSGFGISGLKAALDMVGYYGGAVRPPLVPVGDKEKAKIREILVAVGAIK